MLLIISSFGSEGVKSYLPETNFISIFSHVNSCSCYWALLSFLNFGVLLNYTKRKTKRYRHLNSESVYDVNGSSCRRQVLLFLGSWLRRFSDKLLCKRSNCRPVMFVSFIRWITIYTTYLTMDKFIRWIVIYPLDNRWIGLIRSLNNRGLMATRNFIETPEC